MPDSMETSHNAWVGRKTARLKRPTLDCGHPNAGEVHYHYWCDRLSCSSGCADAPHDCGEFKGSKSGIEEEAVEPEAVVEVSGATADELVSRMVDMQAMFAAAAAAPAGSGAAVGVIVGSAPTCRGCRTPMADFSVHGPICFTCAGQPGCGNERTNALNARRMVCIRPAGHQPPCEEGHPDGSQWYPSGVEQDGYWVATPAPRVDELVEPNPDEPVHPWWKRLWK